MNWEQQLKKLLAEADEISDPQAAGLMDRADCQAMVGKLSAAIRHLMEQAQRAQSTGDEFTTRAASGFYHPA